MKTLRYQEKQCLLTEDGILLLRLRCSDGRVVSISAGVDDVSIVDIGSKLVG